MSNALWGSIGWLAQSADFQLALRAETEFDEALNAARVADDLERAILGTQFPAAVDTSSLERLLRSAEFDHFARNVCAFRLADYSSTAVDALKTEFDLIVNFYLSEESAKVSDILFGAVLQACDTSLAALADAGINVSDATISRSEQRVLQSLLASINLNVERLGKLSRDDHGQYMEFERELRLQVADRTRSITPPSFEGVTAVPLHDVYVRPHLIFRRGRGREQDQATYSYEDFIHAIDRTVVLGDPGAGKSTLAQAIAHDLSSDQVARDPQVTPILVVLRDIATPEERRSHSIAESIERTVRARYQVSDLPTGAISYLLRSGRCLVIFDGLDELTDTAYRRDLVADIDSFANRYPRTPILVTSRRVGYEKAPLDVHRFRLAEMGPFTRDDVEQYATKWFTLAQESSRRIRGSRLAMAFVEESEAVEDLRSNPLMLALMCNIFHDDGFIPQNRPEVFRKCSTMMFERWDKERGITHGLRFESKLRPLLMSLAYGLLSDPQFSDIVGEQDLLAMSTEFFAPLVEDPIEALEVAEGFVAHCTGRAWVFSDVGVDGRGERLFQFTHRTFLEYFAACQLARSYYTPNSLLAELVPRIEAGEWDLVSQLALQILDSNVQDTADLAIDRLIQQIGGLAYTNPFLIFGLQCLSFLTPTARTAREISSLAMARLAGALGLERAALDVVLRGGSQERSDDRITAAELIARALFARSVENAPIVDRVFSEYLLGGLEAGDRWAWEAIAVVPSLVALDGSRFGSASRRATSVITEAVAAVAPQAVERVSGDADFARAMFRLGLASSADIVAGHGAGALFGDEVRVGRVHACSALLLTSAVASESADVRELPVVFSRSHAERDASDLLEVLLAASGPWSAPRRSRHVTHEQSLPLSGIVVPESGKEARDCCLLLAAAMTDYLSLPRTGITRAEREGGEELRSRTRRDVKNGVHDQRAQARLGGWETGSEPFFS